MYLQKFSPYIFSFSIAIWKCIVNILTPKKSEPVPRGICTCVHMDQLFGTFRAKLLPITSYENVVKKMFGGTSARSVCVASSSITYAERRDKDAPSFFRRHGLLHIELWDRHHTFERCGRSFLEYPQVRTCFLLVGASMRTFFIGWSCLMPTFFFSEFFDWLVCATYTFTFLFSSNRDFWNS